MIRTRHASTAALFALVLAGCGSSETASGPGGNTGGTDGGIAGGQTGSTGGASNAGGTGSGAGGAAGAIGAGGASGGTGSGGTGAGGTGAGGTGAGGIGAGGTGAGGIGAGGIGAGGTGTGGTGTGGTGTGGTGTGGARTGDAGTGDGGNDCGADNSACAPSAGVTGFCKAASCVACSGAGDNAACSVAYGSGSGFVCAGGSCVPGNCLANTDCPAGQLCGVTTANQCGACTTDGQCTGTSGYGSGYLCIANVCIKADCRTDASCATGQICGAKTPNNCGACASDAECRADATYGASFICDTSQGKCVTSACTPNGAACTANAADFCCGAACVPGNCCATGDCASLGNNYTCISHTCSLCPQATANTYYVDPVNGNDSVGTGSNGTSACAFKTITRALAFIGATPNAGTQVLVLATGPVGTASGEKFPIGVAGNVTIGGSGGRPQILVPPNTDGFVLSHPASGLTSLAITGQGRTAALGIRVSTGADATTTISHLSVQEFAQDGIRVQGSGMLTIGAGTSSTGNGANNASADGLHIQDTGVVSINVTSGDAVHFDGNAAHGILVRGSGSIHLTGKPGTNGNGTVTTNQNTLAGLWIEQTPGAGSPENVVTGLVAWANTGNGARFVGGSAVKLRGSTLLANEASGVLVSTFTASALRSNDVSMIDLGTTAGTPSPGANIVQGALGGNPNFAAGICLSLDRLAGSTLHAAGNIFAGPTDCATSTATLTRNNTCSKAVDVSVQVTGPSANNVVVSTCQ